MFIVAWTGALEAQLAYYPDERGQSVNVLDFGQIIKTHKNVRIADTDKSRSGAGI